MTAALIIALIVTLAAAPAAAMALAVLIRRARRQVALSSLDEALGRVQPQDGTEEGSPRGL